MQPDMKNPNTKSKKKRMLDQSVVNPVCEASKTTTSQTTLNKNEKFLNIKLKIVSVFIKLAN